MRNSGEDVVRFAADFEQHCEDSAPALFGAVRFNSNIGDLVPFGGQYPRYQLMLDVPVHGRVTGPGIDCGGPGAACLLTPASATVVALTATPDAGYVFGGWTGDCHGGLAASVHLNTVKHCAALFIPTIPAASRTLLNWKSSPGDYIGQGRTETYAAENSRWTVALRGGGRGVEVRITSLDDAAVSDWYLWFDAPEGQTLQPGTNYTGATRSPFATTTPGIWVFGNGRGCNQVEGEFHLRQFVLGPGNKVLRLALDFTQHCEQASAPPLTGSLHYNATVDMPTMALDKTSLRFAGVTSPLKGLPIMVTTGPQEVRLAQSGPGPVTWTATPSVPWLTVTPSSGTGSATLSVAVAMVYPLVQPSGTATITFTFVGTTSNPGPIDVTWTLSPSPLVTFGAFDTPIDHSTGVTGAVPFTGWALDSIDVIAVRICRETVPGEQVGISVLCNSTAQVYVGDATFIDGARPDVAAAFPTYPRSRRAGWGFMVLTNMLPAQGNGTYVFHAYAYARPTAALDLGGLPRVTDLGTKTLTCANASATKPFGAIDTPEQGGLASGAGYINFGWALTPQTKTIPFDGSTITVLVDGAPVGTADYNHFRSDIAAIFPGRTNSNGAVGFRIIDTTSLTNGMHTISWVVTDDQGSTEGIGEPVLHGVEWLRGVDSGAADRERRRPTRGARNFVPRQRPPTDTSVLARDRTSLAGRRGWDLSAPLRTFEPDDRGRVVVRSEEVNRIELHLGPDYTVGYLQTNDGQQALPIGSQIDGSGVFTWSPGVGFVGAYDFVFVRPSGDEAASRRDVRILLAPKGSGLVGPQVVVDSPRSQQDVAQPFVLGGWAADPSAAQGTGVATVHAWAYPLTGGPPVFLGATVYGGARPDVAAVHGDQFEASGFGLVVQGLSPGHYDLAVFAWSIEQAGFAPAKIVRVTVRP